MKRAPIGKAQRQIRKLEKAVASMPKITKRMGKRLLAEWKSIAKRPLSPGDRKPFAIAFEDVVAEEIQSQLGEGVSVVTRDRKHLHDLLGIDVESDVLIESKKSAKKPISIISCKITLATGELKQSIGEAYALAKIFGKHRRSLRYYFVTTDDPHYESETVQQLIDVSGKYLHGAYTLNGPRYLDALISKLRRTYLR
jgi:hypothetical protein